MFLPWKTEILLTSLFSIFLHPLQPTQRSEFSSCFFPRVIFDSHSRALRRILRIIDCDEFEIQSLFLSLKGPKPKKKKNVDDFDWDSKKKISFNWNE